MLAEQLDGQITFGRAHHHPGQDSIVRIGLDVGSLGSSVTGRSRHVPVYPVGEGLRCLPLNGREIEGVSGSLALHGLRVDKVLKVADVVSHLARSPYMSIRRYWRGHSTPRKRISTGVMTARKSQRSPTGGSPGVAFTSIGVEVTQVVHISNRCGSISHWWPRLPSISCLLELSTRRGVPGIIRTVQFMSDRPASALGSIR
jgi:hypothetical protein